MKHRASHKGKEVYHILSDEVTVDHTKRIIAATKGFKGALNNKTVGKFEIQLIFLIPIQVIGWIPYMSYLLLEVC